MDRVLITGGDGFIGSHLAERLLKSGARVRIMDNMTGRRGANVDFLKTIKTGRLEVVEDDIRSLEACRKACQGMDGVLHQAGLGSVSRSVENPLESHSINATGTLNMLTAAKESGAGRFVWASSSSVYGDQTPPEAPKHEAMEPRPNSPYAAAKLNGEQHANLFYRLYGFPAVSLRYFNVFGPRQDPDSPYAAVIPKFIQWILKGEQPRVFGDGLQSRDFTHVSNVVEANIRTLTSAEAPGRVINVANGQAHSLLDLLERLKVLLRAEFEPVFVEPRPGDVRHSLADISLAREILNLKPEMNFDQGLADTVAAFGD